MMIRSPLVAAPRIFELRVSLLTWKAVACSAGRVEPWRSTAGHASAGPKSFPNGLSSGQIRGQSAGASGEFCGTPRAPGPGVPVPVQDSWSTWAPSWGKNSSGAPGVPAENPPGRRAQQDHRKKAGRVRLCPGKCNRPPQRVFQECRGLTDHSTKGACGPQGVMKEGSNNVRATSALGIADEGPCARSAALCAPHWAFPGGCFPIPASHRSSIAVVMTRLRGCSAIR
jgi:hypothetical protein